MTTEKNIFEFEIEGESLLSHRFNGLKEEKESKELPIREQIEKRIYRNDDGVIYAPAEWVRGAMITAFVSRAGAKGGKAKKLEVSPRIMVTPPKLPFSQQEYTIDQRSVPSGAGKLTVRDICYRPHFKDWKITGRITTTLDATEKSMREMFEVAGVDVGIGSNRINGFGRFMVTSFKKLTG